MSPAAGLSHAGPVLHDPEKFVAFCDFKCAILCQGLRIDS